MGENYKPEELAIMEYKNKDDVYNLNVITRNVDGVYEVRERMALPRMNEFH